MECTVDRPGRVVGSSQGWVIEMDVAIQWFSAVGSALRRDFLLASVYHLRWGRRDRTCVNWTRRAATRKTSLIFNWWNLCHFKWRKILQRRVRLSCRERGGRGSSEGRFQLLGRGRCWVRPGSGSVKVAELPVPDSTVAADPRSSCSLHLSTIPYLWSSRER